MNLPKGLTTLHLAFCREICDEALMHLPRTLQSLSCWSCDKISDRYKHRDPHINPALLDNTFFSHAAKFFH